MRTILHQRHIDSRMSHNVCPECRADCERRFVGSSTFRYRFVTEYLSYVKPRLQAIRNGEKRVEAIWWHRDFIRAMHNRINSHSPVNGRKWCDSYLERMGQFPRTTDAGYLRTFARKEASAL